MSMYNLIEYSDDYSEASRSLWQYYKDDPDDKITQSESFKSKKEKLLQLVIQKMFKELYH